MQTNLATIFCSKISTISHSPYPLFPSFETARSKRLFARSGVGRRYIMGRLAVGVNRLRCRPVLGYFIKMKQTFVKNSKTVIFTILHSYRYNSSLV